MPPRSAGPTVSGSGASAAAKKASSSLTAIELRGTPDVAKYASVLREVTRGLAMEVDLTAHELQSKLEKGGASMLDRFASRRAAMKVTRRLRASGSDLLAAGDNAARFWQEYSKTYADLINPQRGTRQTWQWSERGSRPRP